MTRRFLASACILLLVLLAASACGGEDATSVGPSPTATETGTPGTEPEPTTEPEGTTTTGGEVTLEVWFARPESQGRRAHDPRLFAVQRTVPATQGIGAAALGELLGGPTSEEAGEDVTTAVPAGTRLLGLNIADGLATVDLSSEYESGGGSLSMFMRLAQVVYTLTQFPTVDRVTFHLDGKPVSVFSGEGIVLDEPVGRDDYEDLLPTILVLSPGLYAEIGNPVTVSGNANVFEANVTVRILGPDGKELAKTFTTATCGTGCRGDYTLSLPYPAQQAGTRGTVVVQDDDAAGMGFPPHEVRIPVVFG